MFLSSQNTFQFQLNIVLLRFLSLYLFFIFLMFTILCTFSYVMHLHGGINIFLVHVNKPKMWLTLIINQIKNQIV
jgi:hypothetical protein